MTTMKTTKGVTGGGVVLAMVLLMGYLLHTPIPGDMVDSWAFRLIVASCKTGNLLSAVASVVLPNFDNFHIRSQRFLTEVSMPEPDYDVAGSNVTTRYAEFDGVRVLIYEPLYRGEDPIPGFVFCHGGGYAYGSIKLHGPVTRSLAEELNVVLVSIEYRLAPEHPLPAGPNDGITATKYFLRHAHQFGVDPTRVVIGGDSAGSHMTAVVVQAVHDDASIPNLKLQVHFYPWIQGMDFNTPSYQQYENTFGDLGLSKPRVAEFLSLNYIQRMDPAYERVLMSNRHISEEFKRSDLYQQRLSHDIIFEKLGNASRIDAIEYADSSDLSSSWPSIGEQLLEDSLEDPTSTSISLSSSSMSYLSSFLSLLPLSSLFSLQQSTLPSTHSQVSFIPQEHFYPGNDTLWAELKDYSLDFRMAPLFREDFRGLPKAFIATGDLDILRDDGIFYAHALEQADVEVTWRNYQGAWHAIVAAGPITDIPTGVRMLNDAVQFVKENL